MAYALLLTDVDVIQAIRPQHRAEGEEHSNQGETASLENPREERCHNYHNADQCYCSREVFQRRYRLRVSNSLKLFE